jgi:hypothetical protein
MGNKEIINTEDGRMLGFIARLNGQDRVPIGDPKMAPVLSQNNIAEVCKAWLQGWDECNIEYRKTPHQYSNKK